MKKDEWKIAGSSILSLSRKLRAESRVPQALNLLAYEDIVIATFVMAGISIRLKMNPSKMRGKTGLFLSCVRPQCFSEGEMVYSGTSEVASKFSRAL